MTDAKPDAWMPLYIGDWDGDTRHLDCEQDGAYGRLVRHYWRNGPLPDDDGALARIVGMERARWRRIVRPALEPFFAVAEGLWRHKRVDAERVKWAEKKARATERARQAAEARWSPDEPPTPKRRRKSTAQSNATSIASGTPQAVREQCPSSSSVQVEGPLHSPSTLNSRANGDLRCEDASPPRSDVVVDFPAEARDRSAERAEIHEGLTEMLGKFPKRRRRG